MVKKADNQRQVGIHTNCDVVRVTPDFTVYLPLFGGISAEGRPSFLRISGKTLKTNTVARPLLPRLG